MKALALIVSILLYVGIGIFLERIGFKDPAFFAAYGSIWASITIAILLRNRE